MESVIQKRKSGDKKKIRLTSTSDRGGNLHRPPLQSPLEIPSSNQKGRKKEWMPESLFSYIDSATNFENWIPILGGALSCSNK